MRMRSESKERLQQMFCYRSQDETKGLDLGEQERGISSQPTWFLGRVTFSIAEGACWGGGRQKEISGQSV